MENCLFCKIANKEIPSNIIYEDDICTCFLDISQQTKGHCLVVCKQHYEDIINVDEKVLTHMMSVVKKISSKLVESNFCKGVNIINNCKEISGQTIMHFHIHIIPRYDENEMIIKPNKLSNHSNDDLLKIKEEIIKIL